MKAIHIKAFDIWYGMEKGAGGGIHAEEKASFTTTLTARRLLYLFEKERERRTIPRTYVLFSLNHWRICGMKDESLFCLVNERHSEEGRQAGVGIVRYRAIKYIYETDSRKGVLSAITKSCTSAQILYLRCDKHAY